MLYEKVFEDTKKDDWTDCTKLKSYLENFKRFDFNGINHDFKLIEDNGSESLYIPLNIEIPEDYIIEHLKSWDVLTDDGKLLSGEKLFYRYVSVIENDKLDFSQKQIDLKKLTGLMSQFVIAVYPKIKSKLNGQFDEEKGKYGYLYLSHFEECYSIEEGFDLEKAENDVYL